MVRAVILKKESFTAFFFTLLASIALKSRTCQLETHVENLLKTETPLNVISV